MTTKSLRVDYLDALTGQVFDLETYDFRETGDYIIFTRKTNADDFCMIRKDEIRIDVYEVSV